MSSHPTALALVHSGKEGIQKLTIPHNFHEIPGAGVEGDVNGEHIAVGSDSIFHDVSNEERRKMIEMAEEKANSGSKMVAFVGINGKPAGR